MKDHLEDDLPPWVPDRNRNGSYRHLGPNQHLRFEGSRPEQDDALGGRNGGAGAIEPEKPCVGFRKETPLARPAQDGLAQVVVREVQLLVVGSLYSRTNHVALAIVVGSLGGIRNRPFESAMENANRGGVVDMALLEEA
jgi:hypothetical protein